MTKKEARAKCREFAIKNNIGWWALCWNKQAGYYPANQRGTDTNQICWVDKSGKYIKR